MKYCPVCDGHRVDVAEARRVAEDAIRKYNDLLAKKRVVTCVFCGHPYPYGTPASQDAVLVEHIKRCPKHPLRAAEKRLEVARRLLLRANEHVTGRLRVEILDYLKPNGKRYERDHV